MPMATMADAHREWHLNAGVPMGTAGCPQDACHPIEDYEPEPGPGEGVKCGSCKERHWTVAEVKECYALRATPKPAPVAATPAPAPARVSPEEIQSWRSIPVGKDDTAYYALETKAHDHVAFFRVRRPSTGKYAGRTYVDQQSSDNFDSLPFREAAAVLSAIAKNPGAAAVLYGQKMQRCAMCRRSLTDDVNRGPDGLTSLERGIGPTCAKKVGIL